MWAEGTAGNEGSRVPAVPELRSLLYRVAHNPNLATLLAVVEDWQRQLFELLWHTSNDQEITLLSQLLGRAHVMRDRVLRLRVAELARALRR